MSKGYLCSTGITTDEIITLSSGYQAALDTDTSNRSVNDPILNIIIQRLPTFAMIGFSVEQVVGLSAAIVEEIGVQKTMQLVGFFKAQGKAETIRENYQTRSLRRFRNLSSLQVAETMQQELQKTQATELTIKDDTTYGAVFSPAISYFAEQFAPFLLLTGEELEETQIWASELPSYSSNPLRLEPIIERLQTGGFTPQEIEVLANVYTLTLEQNDSGRIATREDGIAILRKHFKELPQVGFSKEQLIQLAGNLILFHQIQTLMYRLQLTGDHTIAGNRETLSRLRVLQDMHVPKVRNEVKDISNPQEVADQLETYINLHLDN